MNHTIPPIFPRLVYSSGYDIHFMGLENLHPFDSCKYSRTWKALLEEFGQVLPAVTLTPTAPVETAMLQQVHTAEYLRCLKNSRYIAQALELGSLGLLPAPILERHVLKPMQLAAMGTVMAAEAALVDRIAINLSGGYHHASADHGEGFCLYADIAIAIAHLRQSQKLTCGDEIAIIDLDAHQGNGLARIFHHDPSVHILDIYNREIYPHDLLARERINFNLPLPAATQDDLYLSTLKDSLPAFLQTIRSAKIAFYNAGTDIYKDDPLGCLSISEQGILERDQFVFHTLTEAGIPWVMVLSGGYTRKSYQLVANSVAYVLKTWSNRCPTSESSPV
jgi:histone deacetylase 11